LYIVQHISLAERTSSETKAENIGLANHLGKQLNLKKEFEVSNYIHK